jgi:Spy/CpxP family protein refolding chaperone
MTAKCARRLQVRSAPGENRATEIGAGKNSVTANRQRQSSGSHMKRKIITLAALATLSLGGIAFAQDQDSDAFQHRGGSHGMHGDMMAKMTESLNLTADQKAKIQPILDEAKPKMEDIRREAMQKMKAVMDDVHSKIRPLLTPEQQQKLDSMKNERHGHHRQNDGDNGGGDDNG